MRTDGNALRLVTLLYIYVPVVIFVAGMTAWYVSSVALVITGISFYKMMKDLDPARQSGAAVISRPVLILIILLITVVAVMLGFGGLMGQADDWNKHNALLHDLIEKDWPVMYTSKESAMLTYYVGQYLVPAVAGKIAGFEAGSLVMALWGIAGLILVYLNLVRIVKADTTLKQICCLIILIMFSGALILAQGTAALIFSDRLVPFSQKWLMAGELSLQYRSNAVMLRWVYPQIITIWLICLMFYEHRRNVRYYVMLLIPSLLFGSFSAVFLAGSAVILALAKLIRSDSRKQTVKEILSLSNIGMTLSLGIILVFYLLGFLLAPKPHSLGFSLISISASNIVLILVFDLFMFGIYVLLTFAEHKRNVLFYCTFIFLTFLPFFKMGDYNDLVMGMSVPALFFVMVFVMETLNADGKRKGAKVRCALIVMFLLIGVWYPVQEFRESFYLTSIGGGIEDNFKTFKRFTDRTSDEKTDLVYNYFTYDPEDSLFYRYLAR